MDPTYDLDYYIKIVGTKYENIFTSDKECYQFTALKASSINNPQIPAVSFKYEFDPISMRYYWKNASFTSLFISIFGIVGGVFAFSKLFNSIL